MQCASAAHKCVSQSNKRHNYSIIQTFCIRIICRFSFLIYSFLFFQQNFRTIPSCFYSFLSFIFYSLCFYFLRLLFFCLLFHLPYCQSNEGNSHKNTHDACCLIKQKRKCLCRTVYSDSSTVKIHQSAVSCNVSIIPHICCQRIQQTKKHT